MADQRVPAYLQQGKGAPNPFVFVDVPVPPHLLKNSPVASPVAIPWSHSAYNRESGPPLVAIPQEQKPANVAPKKFGRPRLAQPLSSIDAVPSPAPSPVASEVLVKDVAFAGSNQVTIYVNGQKHVLDNPEPLLKLNTFIRSLPGLTGTKQMCFQGGCGVCTVLLSYKDILGKDHTVSVNSCLRPVAQCDGMSVTTIEGIGSVKNGMDPVQEAIVDHNGSQCGMCTPGFVMQMKDLLVNKPAPSSDDVESHFDGNICRCTGYRPILDAFQSFAKNKEEGGKEENGNEENGKEEKKGCFRDIEDLSCCSKVSKFCEQKVDPPRPLLLKKASEPVWYHPTDLDSLYSIIQANSTANRKLVVGNTTNGIWPDKDIDLYIDVRSIPELLEQTNHEGGITFGGSVTLTELIAKLEETIGDKTEVQTRGFRAVLPHVKRVASHQIRNVGCIAGNIMATYLHEDFPSDFMLCSITLGVTVTVGNAMVPSEKPISIPLWQLYDANLTNRVILSFFWPFTKDNEYVMTYKIALRRQFAHAIVNAGFRVRLNHTTMVVEETPTFVYGGIRHRTARASATEHMVQGQVWTTPNLLQDTLKSLQEEMIPEPSMGRDEYRSSLINSYFYKFYLYSLEEAMPGTLSAELRSTAYPEQRVLSTGEAVYDEDPLDYKLPQFVPKLEGKLQATGEAIYHPDIPTPANTLHAAIVISTMADADIADIDASAALAVEGVVAVYTAEDIPHMNRCDTALGLDKKYWDPILAKGHVDYYGQAVALLVAESRSIALSARSLVKVSYKNERPAIVTIDDAIAKNSLFDGVGDIGPVQKGDVDQGLKDAPNVITGRVELHDQYHFHMETQTCLTLPKEDNQYELFFSTQWASVGQYVVAKMLGVTANNITVNVKRIGGSYGAKISRATQHGCLSTLASYHTNRPVILQLDLNTNMQLNGKRHPYLCDYTVGFTDEGKVTTFKAHVYAGAGFTLEGTDDCLSALLNSLDNCYSYANFYATATCLRTNMACNTFMRGPGYVQSIFFSDQVFEHIAQILNRNPDDLKRQNFYKKGEVTPVAQTLSYWSMSKLWDQLVEKSDYAARYLQIKAFNQANKYVKKGISLVPCKYGMETISDPFNSLVSILPDGSVLVSHGGTEVGQGINTKVAQAAAIALNIDVKLIRIGTTSTLTTPNSSATGGSITSELCVKSVGIACLKLRKRMNPIRQILGGIVEWQKLVDSCIFSGVNLSSTGTEWEVQNTEDPFKYNSYSAACAEVSIDVLTGEVTVERVDILFDCGTSLNPIIDMGQVQGGFLQGLGYYLNEELTKDLNTGQVTSFDTWEYKPPMTYDMPIDFRVEFLADAPNPKGILGSKASGEPPTCIGSCVFWATQHAIIASRVDSATSEDPLIFNTPATVDVVQQICGPDSSQFSV